ncbi:sugar ABC transporter substrate-binding protein, partial [Streptomyces sp. 2MCAF27]
PFDVTTNWNRVRLLMGQELPRAFLGDLTVAETIENINPRLNVLMRQHRDAVRQADRRGE